MAHYIKQQREEIDGTYLDTLFALGVHDLVYVQVALEYFLHEGPDDMSADELIFVSRMLQLVERAYGDQIMAQDRRLSDQEAAFYDEED